MAERAVAARGFVASADGTRLAYRAWPLERAAVTFAVVHGLGEHSGRYERFAQGMAAYGMATYAVDLRGHGESPGQRGHIDEWSQWVDDAASFVYHVESRAQGEVVPLGHSFGGAVILSTVLAGKLAGTKRFVLSSPALRLKAEVPGWKATLGRLSANLAPRMSMSNEVDPRTVSRIPEVVEAYRADPLVHNSISSRLFSEWQHAAATILSHADEIRVPFLIVAGTADTLIDPAGSRSLHDKAPALSELRLLDGRYHEPFNDLGNEEVFALISEWLTK